MATAPIVAAAHHLWRWCRHHCGRRSCAVSIGGGGLALRPRAREDRRMTIASEPTDLDVLIVGAGISGIGAASYLTARLPGRSFAILEGRDAIGGTWDLF